MTQPFPQINISPVGINSAVTSAMTDAVVAASQASFDANSTQASAIQKRGFTYRGDSHNAWGMGQNGAGIHGWGVGNGGRGVCSIQPFGLGTSHMASLNGASLSPSLFGGSGANAVLNKNTQLAHTKMAMCVEAYKGFGIIKNVIDLMCNFAAEGLKIVHPRPSVQKFYERWAEIVDLEGIVKKILRYYYKYGNLFVYTTMATISDVSRKKMMSTRGGTDDASFESKVDFVERQKEKPLGEREIPWRYTLMNPFQMDIRGSKFFGESRWVFVLDEDTFNEIKAKQSRNETVVDVLDETDINLPPEFKNLPKEEDRVIVLDPSKLWVIQYMKDDHEDWADPMIWPVMNDVLYKRDLRAMDRSVINSTINAITIFKLGSIKDGFVAPPEHYRQFAEMLRTPTYSHNIIWNDAITMESNYPPIEKILGVEKYKSVDKDILSGMGIPSILVGGGEGGSFSNAFLQVRTLLERLEDGRTEVLKWIQAQLRMIAEVMGHRDIPQVRFGQMSLRDEQAEKKLVIQLLDRNVISAERVHEVFGMETSIELERMKREEEDGVFVKHGPYTDPMNTLSLEEVAELELEQQLEINEQRDRQQRKTQMEDRKKNKNAKGRPPGSGGEPQEKKRETKPQGMGLGILQYEKLKSFSLASYDKIEKNLTKRLIKDRGVKYKKSLSKEDRSNLEYLTFMIFSNIQRDDEIDDDFIDFILMNPTINRKVEGYYKSSAENIDELTATARREMKAVALATYLYEGE